MAIKIPSHLSRNRYGVLHFRLAVPADLQGHFNVKEIYRSLHTASVRAAIIEAQPLSIALKRAFTELRSLAMPNNKTEPCDALEAFRNLPDVKQRLRAAGIQVALQEAEAARDRAEDRHAESEESRAREREQHQRELNLVLRAKGAVIPAPTMHSPTISETVRDFTRFKLAQARWTDKTKGENEAVYELFVRIVGDMRISDVDDDIIVDYLEKLKKLPANINKSPSYLGKSINAIIAMTPPPMSERTVVKNIERVSSLFKWASTKKKYGITHNPAAGMGIKEKPAERRQPFTEAELLALFTSQEFRTRKFKQPYMYWLMPMALLTGARLGELCQLYLTDFVELNGIICIDISDEEQGQRVKNQNAKRLVPLHSKLYELGILDYVDYLRSKGEVRLFPELSERRDGFAQAASNWFQRYRKRCGVIGKHTKVFHSFRHTFISALLDDEVPEQTIAQLVGHEGKLITSQVYWNARDAAKRKPTIERFTPNSDLWSIIPSYKKVTF